MFAQVKAICEKNVGIFEKEMSNIAVIVKCYFCVKRISKYILIFLYIFYNTLTPNIFAIKTYLDT